MASQEKSGPSSWMNGNPARNVQIPNENTNANLSFQSRLISIYDDMYKEKILKLALSASEELRHMAQEQEPLWLFDINNSTEVLNEDEYKRRFITLDETANGASAFKNEASRSIGIVLGSSVSILNILMTVEQWSDAFFNIVSEATTLGVLYPGENENHNGALQVVTAQFHLPSHLFTPREVKFARICKQIDLNTWVVADVSLESVFPNPVVPYLQRRPSGCLIQELKSGLSMVTWVEHNLVPKSYVHIMFEMLLTSNFAFSAKRWIATLQRYYDKIANLDDNSPQPNGLGVESKNMLKLAQRMVKCYARNVSPCRENSWMPLPISGAEEIFVKMSTYLDDVGLLQGIAITFCTSVLLPISQNNLFEFLRNGSNRIKWDLLSIGSNIVEDMRICCTWEPANSVSRIMVESPDKAAKLYLQESFTDSVAMYVVYGPVDVSDSKGVDNVTILPCGFAIMPNKPKFLPGESGSGSILTISFQLMDDQLSSAHYLPQKSVLTIYKIVCETVSLIKTALLCN